MVRLGIEFENMVELNVVIVTIGAEVQLMNLASVQAIYKPEYTGVKMIVGI